MPLVLALFTWYALGSIRASGSDVAPRHCVGRAGIEEMRQRHDALVTDPLVGIEAHDTRQVGLLVPQLRSTGCLGEQVVAEVADIERGPLRHAAEVPARELAHEDTGVV